MTSELRPLNKEFLAERDLRIYQLRAAGAAHQDIAKRLDISLSAVSNAIRRQTEKLNREASIVYPEILRLELERLDKLHAALWPLTQHRNMILDDGTEYKVEPDLKAVDTVLKIQDHRAKLLGMDTTKVQIAVDVQGEVRHQLHGAEEDSAAAIDYKSETLKMLQLMGDSRILDTDTMKNLQASLTAGEEPIEIQEAEIIEEGD